MTDKYETGSEEYWQGTFVQTKEDHEYVHVENPEISKWKCRLFGGNVHAIVWRPANGDEPNWFWRWMQFICFGNRWEKDK